MTRGPVIGIGICVMLGAILTLSGENTDSDYDRCVINLLLIRDALNEYHRLHGNLPDKLSDLRGQFLKNGDRLFCPCAQGNSSISASTELVRQEDPRTSYTYEFSLVPITDIPSKSMRDWKRAQVEIVGERVPIARCNHHDGWLNLPMEGEVYWSAGDWERNFEDTVDPRELDYLHLFSELMESGAELSGSRPAIPERQPDPKLRMAVDLGSHYNATLTPSWDLNISGNDLKDLGSGIMELKGVAFDVRGVIQLCQRTPNSNRSVDRVDGISVDAHCRRLHFLHGCSYGSDDHFDQLVATFVINGKGEKQQDHVYEIVYGRQVLDWWHDERSRIALDQGTEIAWEGANDATDKPIRLYLTTVDLKEKTHVSTIDFIAHKKKPAPFLLAISFSE